MNIFAIHDGFLSFVEHKMRYLQQNVQAQYNESQWGPQASQARFNATRFNLNFSLFLK